MESLSQVLKPQKSYQFLKRKPDNCKQLSTNKSTTNCVQSPRKDNV